jgi:hypothetical protein
MASSTFSTLIDLSIPPVLENVKTGGNPQQAGRRRRFRERVND